MENNNKKNIIIIILLSIIIALLIVGGLFLFNVITFKNNNDEQPKPEENNTETKYSVAEAQDIIDSFKLEDLVDRVIKISTFEFGKNIFESEYNKSVLVTLSIINDWLALRPGNCQGGPYTSYSSWANKYKELFGKDFKYSDSENYYGEFIDKAECEYNVCTSENIKDCYYTYNSVYMSFEGYNLIVQDTSNNAFTGKVYFKEQNKAEILFGTFEFKYNVDDNNNIYIESLIINK